MAREHVEHDQWTHRGTGRFLMMAIGLATLVACSQPEPASRSPQGIDGDVLSRRQDAQDHREPPPPPALAGRTDRSYDGSNNNPGEPEWGASFTHLKRMAHPAYADMTSDMAGTNRPNPRTISNTLVHQGESESLPNPFGGSDFVWQWGQFLDHDLGLTDGTGERADIPVPTGDPWFDPQGNGGVVIPFSRASFDPDTGAESPREQDNEITAWIDGSMVYGSSRARMEALKEPNSPRLKTSEGDRLPYNADGLVNANGFAPDPASLFVAGDVRCNEQVGLAAMHTLFVREHNRIVETLEGTDEERFEQARRMVIAEIQHITYNEFLPALIGPAALPPYQGYDPSMHPGLYNEFSVAAFRIGHSMVNETLLRLDAQGNPVAGGPLTLRNAFFNAPSHITGWEDLDPILRGLAAQPHQKLDVMIVESLRNFLFGPPGAGGLDLVSLNIHRGRDHGMPAYNHMREIMGVPRARTFADITADPVLQADLETAYGHPDLVDLWIGGLAEDPMIAEGSQVGPLFRGILVHQFVSLRDGDRYWYEMHLTPSELAQVRTRTLADIIRDNTGIGAELPDDVFHVP